jgi:hypothetical protein
MLAVIMLGAAPGCGTKSSNYVKVSGLVTLEGVPLEGAKVTYCPASGEAPAMDVTNSAGRFNLKTFDLKTVKSSDGALPGEYKVTVEIPNPTGRTPDNPEAALQSMHMKRTVAPAQKKEPKVLHPNYGDLSKTPLKQTVPPQGPVELKLMKDGT